MVAIGIVSILAALLLGVAAVAATTAREARSKSMIARLHTLVVDRYDLYRTRRVEVGDGAVNNLAIDTSPSNGYSDLSGVRVTDPRMAPAAARLAALRELVKLEMPDRWSDVLGQDVPNPVLPHPPTRRGAGGVVTTVAGHMPARPLLFLEQTPAVWSAYARAYNRLVGRTNTVTDATNTREDIVANQGAELLYLTVIHATGDGEARGLFKEADVDDTDGDGAPEFIDGWGRPIAYVRWAPGFDSDLQLDYAELIDLASDGSSGITAVENTILEDHDPHDLFRVDNPAPASGGFEAGSNYAGMRGWRLVPLILSAGRDGEFGVRLDNDSGDLVTAADPYMNLSGASEWLGQFDPAAPEAYADNLHNHQAGTLSRTR